MTLLFLLGDPNQAGGMSSLFFMGAIFIVFYFFIIRPQSKKQKDLQNKVSSIKKGDKVILSGGIFATIHQIEEDSFLAEIDTNVKIRILKSAIVDVNPNKTDKK